MTKEEKIRTGIDVQLEPGEIIKDRNLIKIPQPSKYHTWDTLRGINKISTTDSVDKEGKGLERFYAPGRNFAASVEIRF